jgi:hypothetical protein
MIRSGWIFARTLAARLGSGWCASVPNEIPGDNLLEALAVRTAAVDFLVWTDQF